MANLCQSLSDAAAVLSARLRDAWDALTGKTPPLSDLDRKNIMSIYSRLAALEARAAAVDAAVADAAAKADAATTGASSAADAAAALTSKVDDLASTVGGRLDTLESEVGTDDGSAPASTPTPAPASPATPVDSATPQIDPATGLPVNTAA